MRAVIESVILDRYPGLKWGGGGGAGGEDYIYTCIKVGSDENHINVSLLVRDKVTTQCPQITTSEE